MLDIRSAALRSVADNILRIALVLLVAAVGAFLACGGAP